VVSERVPRSGALGLGLMGTVGMATVGLVTSPVMGGIADRYAHERLPRVETVAVMERARSQLAGGGPDEMAAAAAAGDVLASLASGGALPQPGTANALRAIVSADAPDVSGEAQAILGPADNYGGRISFRYVAPLCAVLALIFGVLYARDRHAGGYRAERIEAAV
jgi:hypothetical protein